MASSVDFPQPDGPEIDRYSPRWISRSIPSRACVSTSSVTNTFFTFCMLMSGSGMGDPFSYDLLVISKYSLSPRRLAESRLISAKNETLLRIQTTPQPDLFH